MPMISWGATKYYPGGHGTFIGKWTIDSIGQLLGIYKKNTFFSRRYHQFVRPHHYVLVLFTRCHGTKSAKVSVVEEAHHQFANGTCSTRHQLHRFIYFISFFSVFNFSIDSILFGIPSFVSIVVVGLRVSTLVGWLHFAQCHFLLLLVQQFLSKIVQTIGWQSEGGRKMCQTRSRRCQRRQQQQWQEQQRRQQISI